MNFTLENVINSLAGVVQSGYPDYPVYTSPNQQGTKAPCFFIFFMVSSIEDEIGNRFTRDLGVDIIFVQKRNIVNGNAEILSMCDFLDEALEQFPYVDENENKAVIRTSERQWQKEDDELHYQFHIKQRVSVPTVTTPMKKMEENNASIKANDKK